MHIGCFFLNPAYGRHQIARPMRIVAQIFFHEDIAAKFYVIFFHEEIAGYGPLQSSTLQCPELCLIDQDSQEYFLHQEIAGYGPLQSSTLQSPELCLIYQDSEEQNLEEVPAIT